MMRPGWNIAALAVQLRGARQLAHGRQQARAAGRDVVHLAAVVEAEDASVRREEIARKRARSSRRCSRSTAGAGRPSVSRISGTIAAAAAALHVDLAVQQRRGRGVPARRGSGCCRAPASWSAELKTLLLLLPVLVVPPLT